jgi:small subunit ribosomal protein S6
MFIVSPTLTEEETKKQFENIKNIIIENKGEIAKETDMGSKALAYEIEKHKRGHYYLVYFTAPTTFIKELERVYKVNESVLRFIIIKSDSKSEVLHWTNQVNGIKKEPKIRKPRPAPEYNRRPYNNNKSSYSKPAENAPATNTTTAPSTETK